MSVHQMGYDDPWSLAADVRTHAFFSALYQSRITLLTSLLTMVVIILSLIDQINYIDEQERVRLLREDFSYAMVHDMKSPLTSIIMGTKYLHSGVLEKKPEMKDSMTLKSDDEDSSMSQYKDMFMDTVIEQMSDTIVEKSGENITQQLYEQMKRNYNI